MVSPVCPGKGVSVVKASDPVTALQHAEVLWEQGFQVFPARYKHKIKAPIVKWRPFQNARVPKRNISRWFSNGKLNVWVLCGRLSNIVVLDTDSEAGETWWRERGFGEYMDRTAAVKTFKGRHYWFRIPDGWEPVIQSWAIHPETHDTEDVSFDFRAEGGGVLAPPSVHETGHVYRWERPLTEMIDAPTALLDGTYRELAPSTRTKGGEPSTTKRQGGGVSSLLVSLLSHPPTEGGRNDWLARVAGHYAKQYRNQWDLFELHCNEANAKCSPPLDDAEFTKTIQSLWDSEHGKDDDDVKGLTVFSSDGGWVRGSGRRIFTQVRTADPDTGEASFDVAEWANFDIKALGVSEHEDGGEVDYWVKVFRDVGNIEVILPGKVLGDSSRLNVWLAGLRVSVMPPDNMFPRTGSFGTRLSRYLESQTPPSMRVTRVLGWDRTVLSGEGGFVTHDNVITATGKVAFADAGIRPDPGLMSQGVAAHHYGRAKTKREAKSTLRELLTFHDETVCSVFGAWWAACLLKPQIHDKTALFPIMAIEAPSESGKTNGFFDMMVQLNGNRRGETVPTFAALRSMAAAHRNGIVWVDDLDDPSRLMELLRAATSNGTITKMGDSKAGNWTATSDSQIVSPVVISGEALGLDRQKALLDRSILLDVPSPTQRKSFRDPSRSQWDDVLAMRARYPNGLSSLAGWFVQSALRNQSETLAALEQAKSVVGRGRNADKNAILLAGAKLLDALVARSATAVKEAWQGRGMHYERVHAWVIAQTLAYNPNENALTLEILPWALSKYGWPTEPEHSPIGDHTPAWVEKEDTGTLDSTGVALRFNCNLLAAAWEHQHRGKVETRTHSAMALQQQARAVAERGKGKNYRLMNGPASSQKRYVVIRGELAQTLLARSRS